MHSTISSCTLVCHVCSCVLFFYLAAKNIFWEEPKKATVKGSILQYDGTPFVIKSLVVLQCQHGKDKNARRKKNHAEMQANNKEVNMYSGCIDN